MDEPLIPAHVWERATEPDPERARVQVVHDPTLGTIAELTTPDGRRFYGTDGPIDR